MDQAINPSTSNQQLLEALHFAFNYINTLYEQRNINDKLRVISTSLNNWNTTVDPKQLVDGYTTLRNQFLEYNANDEISKAYNEASKPRNLNVSWWNHAKIVVPCNAYMSSFDEHVMILHNLLTGWTPAPRFAEPTPTSTSANANATKNFGPYITVQLAPTTNTFENAVYVYTQANKILTLLSKMGSDGIQIKSEDQQLVANALNEFATVDMSWSMDAKFTSAVGEGAFIPNSSALHNPFICTKLLDPKEWKFVDFEEIAVLCNWRHKPVAS
jgi:hypothetical protein